jgi:hypothetical protein
MQTDRMLYLALRSMVLAMEQDQASGDSGNWALTDVPEYLAARAAMAQYEIELGPLPEWASAFNITQEPVLFAQLYTKNGRQRGNGMIYDIGSTGVNFGVITDMGNTSALTREELLSIYEIGDFILNEEGYLKRKRQNPDLAFEDEPE